jgi:hypothetical protein
MDYGTYIANLSLLLTAIGIGIAIGRGPRE